jgi:hypothetical protein
MTKPSRAFQFAGILACAPLVGCGDAFTLPPATQPIVEQQIILYALTGTSVNTPSAYSLTGLAEIRTDQSSDFDFAFQVGPDSAVGVGSSGDTVAALIPRAWFGFAPDGGILPSNEPFAEMLLAPVSGYESEKPTVIVEGFVGYVASRRQVCNFGLASPRYARMIVQELDLALRRVVIRLHVDPNCGYRGLGSGIPSR